MYRACVTATLIGLATVSPLRAADRPAPAGPGPVVELYGAALDMPAAQVRALAPGTADGHRCRPTGNSKLLLLECGRYRVSAVFTGTGRTWHLRAAVDLSASPLPAETLTALLSKRYGDPTAVIADTDVTLVWLPGPGTRQMAERCLSESILNAALLERDDRRGPLPHRSVPPTPGCFPLRFAILASLAPGVSRGLIVDVMDPTQRIAELTPAVEAVARPWQLCAS